MKVVKVHGRYINIYKCIICKKRMCISMRKNPTWTTVTLDVHLRTCFLLSTKTSFPMHSTNAFFFCHSLKTILIFIQFTKVLHINCHFFNLYITCIPYFMLSLVTWSIIKSNWVCNITSFTHITLIIIKSAFMNKTYILPYTSI